MKPIQKKVRSAWSVALLVVLGLVWAVIASAFPSVTGQFAYDEQNQLNIDYDALTRRTSGYDLAGVLTVHREESRVAGPSDLLAEFCGFLAAEGGIPNFIYRTGSQTENALTDAAGVSFRDSISSSANRAQVFDPGAKIWAVDTSKLPSGSVVLDGNPAGHVSVFATPSEIRAAIGPQSPANPLGNFGLKLLEDGTSYRIPKK